MKKLTAFFMALMPLLVTVLLFAAGLIVKNQTHVYVQSVEISTNSQEIQKPDDTQDKTFQLNAHVLPMNSTVPDIVWTTSDEKVLQVNDEGLVTCKDYGKAYVYAVSKENSTLAAKCEVEVYDTKIHQVVVSDEEKDKLSYVGINTKTKINTTTKPATHIENPTLLYEPADTESANILAVAGDGTILPKKEGKAKVNIAPETDKSRVTQVEVNIALGVDEIDVKDRSTTITTESTYDLYNDLVVYPEQKENSVKRTDFIYEAADQETADSVNISADGKVTFKKPSAANFNISYKRDATKKTSKSVFSTCTYLADVQFNTNHIEQTIKWDSASNKYTPTTITNLNCEAFPKIENIKDKLTVQVLEGQDVVTVNKPTAGNLNYTFIANKPGTAIISAEALTGPSMGSVKRDMVLVDIIPETTSDYQPLVKQQNITLEPGMFYYPLRNNINLPLNQKHTNTLTFAVDSSSDCATINDSKEVINFSKSGTAKVNVYNSDSLLATPVATMNITAPAYITEEIEITTAKDKYVLDAGKRYKFKNATPIWSTGTLIPIAKPYAKNFDYQDKEFSAKYGFSTNSFEVTMDDGKTRMISIIVKEKPLYINTDIISLYETTAVEIENYPSSSGAVIVPSTATKEDGTGYALTYLYEPENESVAKIEENNIKFLQPGFVTVTTSCEDLKLTNIIKSTYGTYGKFDLFKYDGDIPGTTPVVSNTQYDLAHNGTYKFTVQGLSYDEAKQITASTLSASSMLDIKVETIRTSLIPLTYKVDITVTPKSDSYGTETIVISTKTHTKYIKFKLESQIDDIRVVYNNDLLSNDSNKSYTKTLQDVVIMPYPLVAKDQTFTATLNGSAVTITNNKATLNLNEGDNNLVLSWTKDGATTTKTYPINVDTTYSGLKVTLSGADKDNNIYLQSNQLQTTMNLKANGFVDRDFFEGAKFSAEVEGGQQFGKAQFVQDTLTITGMPSPKDCVNYSKKLTLKCNETVLSTYTMTRDVVSRIKLPNHNNDDMTDKKGMQKVHVYGDKSFDNATGGFKDYYTLPINLYDYKYELITDLDLKKTAFDTLVYSFSDNKSTLEYKDGALNIKFAPDSRYTVDEIANNAFDSKTNKNVTFEISSKSQVANTKYTFVVVDGLNVVDQEGIRYARDNGSLHLVFQNDFGIEGGAQFDITDLDILAGIYGNGHTVLMRGVYASLTSARYIFTGFILNATVQGFKDSEFGWKNPLDINVQIRDNEYSGIHYFEYCIFKNFMSGVGTNHIKHDTYFKNCVMYNFLNGAFTNNNVPLESKVYIEDCTFFNAGSFAIWHGLSSPADTQGIYFKGDLRLYNFHNKEMLEHFFGVDASFLWDLVVGTARAKKMVQVGGDGREYINSYMISWLTDTLFFWDGEKYIKSDKGTEQSGRYLSKLIDIKVPFMPNIAFNLWSTTSPDVFPNSPNYYDEFDKDGNLRIDFLQNQILLNSRKINFF